MSFALPKPSKLKKRVQHITVMRDGREICDYIAWAKRKEEVRRDQDNKCARFKKCKTHIFSGGELHHKNGTRGLGGGKRDDRKPNLELLCEKCHDREHGQLWA